MNKYNEVSSLADALIELGICKPSQDIKRRELVREACAALGMIAISTIDFPTERTKYNAVEKGEIVRWLANKYAEPILQRNYADKYKYKTIAFNTDKQTRHVIKLEVYYVDTLKQIGIDNIPVFLSGVTTKEWNETTGDKTIAKIVKCAIVNKLMERWRLV